MNRNDRDVGRIAEEFNAKVVKSRRNGHLHIRCKATDRLLAVSSGSPGDCRSFKNLRRDIRNSRAQEREGDSK